jgi:hypothetical protein
MSSSSSSNDKSINQGPAPAPAPYKTPEGYNSDSCPSLYCYSTKKIDSSNDKSEIKLDLNWDLDSSKLITNKTTDEVNDLVPKVTPVSKKMKSISRQDFKEPPESIDNKSDSSFNGVVAIARPICTHSTLPMKELTLDEFGFKPRLKMKKNKSSTASVVASTCLSSAVAKISDRTDAYEIDDHSFETPPYIKKERSAQLERKAKSITIKKLNKRKKEETKKEETNEDDEFEKNRIKKHKCAIAMSKRLRLEHEERL